MKPYPISQADSLDSLSPEDQQRLGEILESYLADLENGFSPKAEDIIEQYPDLAEPLRSYLSSLDFLHDATAQLRTIAQPQSAAQDSSSKQLGDYTIIREIGRGGMGIVYEAKQISLDRQVALKVLPFAAVLDQKQIARFYNEAQAAAHLHHPNIVPVYSVGCDRGVHYYSMQYVEGQSLDLAIRQLRKLADALAIRATPNAGTETGARAETVDLGSSTWKSFSNAASLKSGNYFQTAARLGIDAAEALDHAHQCGIVHRDVKPSNLLLDNQGKIWITDFGLARFQSNGGLTATGDVMGTIRYMSPEQVAGNSALVDQRTDVYSLGITIYELITLREAFDGADRQAFLRWISDEEPRPPRQINASIPVDLETIVLKAIAKSPQDRYTTAREFADDLRHFLEGKPVLARRAGLTDRTAKWGKRHKTLVGAALVLLLVVLVGSVASALLIASEHSKTKAALVQAESNLHRAETHFRQLREVVDRFGAYHAEQLKDLPGAESLRRQLLLDTLNYYREFIQYAVDDPTLQADLAVSYSKEAAISEQIGDKTASLEAYRRAAKAFGALAAAYPKESRYRADMALCQNNIGLLLSAIGQPAEAEQAYQQALTIQKQLVAEDQNSDKSRSDLALTFGNLGLFANSIDQLPKAEEAYRQAIRIHEQLIEKFPDNPDYLHNLAINYNNLSFLQVKTDPIKAEESSGKARSIQERLVASHPENAEFQSDLALSYNNLGALENNNGSLNKAESSYQQAIAIQEQLVRKSPSVIRFRGDLSVSFNNLGRLYSKSEKFDLAQKSFERAQSIMKALVDDYPNELNYQSSLGGILNNLGMVFEQLDRLDDAATMYEQAIDHQRFASEHAVKVVQYREFLDKHYTNYRRVLRALGNFDKDLKAALDQMLLWRDDPEQLYRKAVALATEADAIDFDKTSSLANDASIQRQYLDLVVDSLGKAVDAGLVHPQRIQDDPDLSHIRNYSGFERLQKQLTKRLE